MSRKQEIIGVFDAMKRVVDTYRTEAKKITTSGDYTQDAQARKLAELREADINQVLKLHSKGVEILEAARAELREKWKKNSAGRFFDGDYQSGLANALRIIEIGAVDASSFKELTEVYQDNYLALDAFRKLLERLPDREYAHMLLPSLPVHERDKTLQALEGLEQRVNCYINTQSVSDNDPMVDFVLNQHGMVDRFNDDLSYN